MYLNVYIINLIPIIGRYLEPTNSDTVEEKLLLLC